MENLSILFNSIDSHRDLIHDAERYIWQNPETGFREWKTSAYLAKEFEKLGYKLHMAGDLPGFYTDVDTGKPGPKILIFGELDSIICPGHPEAFPETGAVHACGHNAQAAALLGIAAALQEEGALDTLCGSIRLCAVPAEELIEIEYREQLRQKGTIRYMGGKPEFLYRGYFGGCDLAFMVHASGEKRFSIGGNHNGCIAKKIRYIGSSAHAAGSPNKGINALYAATLGLNAVNALRETFREYDQIRFHPIVTEGGSCVNAIPAETVIESYVRGRSFEAIIRENEKINRALSGAAAAMGCRLEVTDRPGYSPMVEDNNLNDLMYEAAKLVLPESAVEVRPRDRVSPACTDMGDISSVIPSVHSYAGGITGTSHGSDYYIVDFDNVCLTNAKVQLAAIALLLSDGAKRAKEIISEKNTVFGSAEEYFKTVDSLAKDINAVEYFEDYIKISKG